MSSNHTPKRENRPSLTSSSTKLNSNQNIKEQFSQVSEAHSKATPVKDLQQLPHATEQSTVVKQDSNSNGSLGFKIETELILARQTTGKNYATQVVDKALEIAIYKSKTDVQEVCQSFRDGVSSASKEMLERIRKECLEIAEKLCGEDSTAMEKSYKLLESETLAAFTAKLDCATENAVKALIEMAEDELKESADATSSQTTAESSNAVPTVSSSNKNPANEEKNLSSSSVHSEHKHRDKHREHKKSSHRDRDRDREHKKHHSSSHRHGKSSSSSGTSSSSSSHHRNRSESSSHRSNSSREHKRKASSNEHSDSKKVRLDEPKTVMQRQQQPQSSNNTDNSSIHKTVVQS